MLKIITLFTKLILIALTALLFASCNHMLNQNAIEGSGNITTENRVVTGDFKNVEVSNAIDLVIEQSDDTAILVEADDNLQKGITTKVENGVLIIACEYNSFKNIASKKVIVKMPVINGLEASSASTINSKNVLKGDHISIHSSSGANINVTIEFDTITCDSSSGSEQNLNGKALTLNASASSGSHINARELWANHVIAEVSSGASLNVHPIVNLNAEASSGGNINYHPIPKSIKKNTSSGGTINEQ